MSIHCILSIGSNDGDRELHLQHALNYLAEICETLYCSTSYESPALNGGKMANKPHYLNAVAVVDFDSDLSTLELKLKDFEILEGRDENARAEGRVPIDLDVVIAQNKILRQGDFDRYFFRRGYEELFSATREIKSRGS